jgi:hypothetical protein
LGPDIGGIRGVFDELFFCDLVYFEVLFVPGCIEMR